ncbi:carboxylesterase family protein [Amycolatopsis sp. NPDC047767]|uniref:carboxylesterase family protein n=1 Tax=Amycolatopsis sp. NPDC047767 TaxID=3156765 RepID=UPI0034522489
MTAGSPSGSARRVHVESGELEGTAEDGVAAFLGVPYAAPPSGAARFRPPGPARRWRGVRPAVQFGAAAPQPGSLRARLILGRSVPSGADCLVLNVWAPEGARPGALPVLVWLHGGGFTNGSGDVPALRGAVLAKDVDAVVVTVNYRLGPLGFAWHPDLTGDHANLGLLDQRAALEWVGRNISAFGGDPGRVTLAGDSAGAMSAAIQSALPGAGERISALALHSGLPRLAEPDAAADGVERLAAWLGVPVRALAEAGNDALITAAAAIAPAHRFGPVAAGELARGLPAPGALPTLLGTTGDEGTFFLLDERSPRELSDAEARTLAEALLPGDAAARYEAAARALPPERALGSRWAVAAAATVALFDEPADEWAATAPGPVWRTQYCRPATLWDGWLGATHTLDVPVLFGTHRSPEPARLFDGDDGVEQVSARLRRDYRSFLHRGVLDWPQWAPGAPVVRKVS